MSTTERRAGPAASAGRQALVTAAAAGLTVPGVALRLTGAHLPHPVEAVGFGLAIVGAAFLLAWAAEAAQVDIAASLAIAVLALIAVLPEYAVDFVFAWKGGDAYQSFGPACRPPGAEASSCSLALANMTGANRILIGLGWSLVVLVAVWRGRRAGRAATSVELEPTKSVELVFLAMATAYSLTLPLRSSLTLLDALVLIGIFVVYTLRISRAPPTEPDLLGPSAWIGGLGRRWRRWSVGVMLVGSAAVILLTAEPFAEALVTTGTELGISEFFLVQWLAPLASEAPELLVAVLYAWRLKSSDALGTLLSSKVNQWTLLVGSVPIVFAVAAAGPHGLPMEPRQREELLLTAAQSLFALALLVDLDISLKGAAALLGLFLAQFAIHALAPPDLQRLELAGLSALYVAAALVLLVRRRDLVAHLARNGLRTPFRRLAAAPPGPRGAHEAAGHQPPPG